MDCKRTRCFANNNGACIALNKVEANCSFFKTNVNAVIENTKAEPLDGEKFKVWFKGEWDAITSDLLQNHREKIAKINIVKE